MKGKVGTIPKVFLKKKKGGYQLHFRTPFSVIEDRVLHCQHGQHYYQPRPSKNIKNNVQTTKKLGCLAYIQTKTFVLYPEYCNDIAKGTSQRAQKRLQKEKLDE